MVRTRALALVALSVAALVTAGVPVSQSATAASTDSVVLPPNGTQLPADSTAISIALRPDGTAVWAVQYRIDLDGNTTAAFESARDRIRANPLRYTGPFAEMMERAASAAAEETGRSMAIRNVSVRATRLPTRTGVVVYRFEWTAFAATDGNRLSVGDALVRFSLPEERSSLLVQWPAGYELERASPAPDETRNRSVVWEGPIEFAPAEPQVVVDDSGTVPLAPVGAAVALALVALGAVGLWRHRRGPTTADGTGSEPASSAGSAGDTGGVAGDTVTADEGTASDEVPEELLSDAERVLNLLEENGGRMKQQDVVSALDWSETKTSQVVQGLRDEGKIEVYRIGRENVLSLPGEMDV